MNPIERLTQLFEKFPGIGPRQARRFVQYLLVSPHSARQELAELIRTLGAQTSQCKKCYRWFAKVRPLHEALTQRSDLCTVCAEPGRDTSILFVVEKDADIENVERSAFKGLYFVLGGTIPLATEDTQKYVRERELLTRVKTDGPILKELILGLSATTEGDHTREILAEKLRPFTIKISSLGRGLSTGTELEYADPDTIEQALGNRH